MKKIFLLLLFSFCGVLLSQKTMLTWGKHVNLYDRKGNVAKVLKQGFLLSAKEYSLDKSSYIVTYLGKKYQVSKDALRSPGDVELLYKRKMADQDALDRKNNLRLTQIENELLALYVTNLALKRDTALVYQDAVLRQNA